MIIVWGRAEAKPECLEEALRLSLEYAQLSPNLEDAYEISSP